MTATGTTRALWALALTTFVSMTGYGLLVPVTPFLADALGARATGVTWALGAYALGQLLSAPLWGRISDRFGRRPALAGSLILAGLLYVALAYVQAIWELGFVRFAAGLAAGNVATAFAVAADLSAERTRARAMGVLGAGLALGFIVGPSVGGLLAGAEPAMPDYQRVCYAAAAVTFASVVGILLFLPESRPQHLRRSERPASFSRILSRPGAKSLLGVTVVFFAAFAIVETIVALWADARIGWGPREVGLLMGAVGFFAAALQAGGAGPIAERFGERALLLAGIGAFAVGLAVLIPAKTAWLAFAGGALVAAGYGMVSPSLQSFVSQTAPAIERGALLGVSQAAASLGRILGPAMAGPLFQHVGAGAPYAAGLVMALACLGLAHLATRPETRARRRAVVSHLQAASEDVIP